MSGAHRGNGHDLRTAQIALVRHQQWAIARGEKALIIFEGRDGAGKDGAIKRITEHLAVRNTRAIALPKPTDRERSEWWFQRYVAHLPAAGEIAIFNRSWYNRAGVERVMGFSSASAQEAFLHDAPTFERLLTQSSIRIVKLWIDISKSEQASRLQARRDDPVKALKVSALDAVAQERWADYSAARDEMLGRTHTVWAPWTLVHTDDKKQARIAILRHLVHTLAAAEVRKALPTPDREVLFAFDAESVRDGRLEP